MSNLTKETEGYTVVKDSYSRRVVRDSMYMAMKRPLVGGWFHIDLTEISRRIWAMKDAGADSNITIATYLMYAYAKTVEKYPFMNSMNNYKGDLYTFKDVDLLVPIQILREGVPKLRPAIIRKVNTLSLDEIAQKIKKEQEKPSRPMLPSQRFFLNLPFFLRKQFYKLLLGLPLKYKHQLGTSTFSYLKVPESMPIDGNENFTSVSMHTASLTICAPVYDRPEEGDYQVAAACLMADHRLVDGMPVLEAGNYFRNYLLKCEGLPEPNA